MEFCLFIKKKKHQKEKQIIFHLYPQLLYVLAVLPILARLATIQISSFSWPQLKLPFSDN